LQQLLTRNGLSEGDFRKQLEQSALREKLQAAFSQDQVPTDQDQQTSDNQKAFDDWLTSHRSQDVKLQFSQSDKDWVLGRIGVRP
jgi:hypothetical protein